MVIECDTIEGMYLHINLNLSEKSYKKYLQMAQRRHQDISSFLEDFLEDDKLRLSIEQEVIIDLSEPDRDVEREQKAYIALHPQLKKKYLDQYVAILNGKLVDYDTNYGTLFERIQDQYGNQFVWLSKVESDPQPVRHWRSSRISTN